MSKRSCKLLGRSSLLFLVFVLLLGSSIAWAQSTGNLKGKVVDRDKLPLPTAKVSMSGLKTQVLTGIEGEYFIRDIPPGVYKVTVELAGFINEVVKDVSIQAGKTTELDIKMNQGFAHEVTITARREVETLQKVSQNIEVLTATELDQTPSVNILQSLNNVTGVDVETGSGKTSLGTFMSIDGYDDIYIKKMVDGVDIGEVVSNWSMINSYPKDMVEQIEVIKGGSSSVWGSNMGGIINVITKRPRNMEKPTISLRGSYGHFGNMNFENASAYPNSGGTTSLAASITGSYKDFGYMLGYNNDAHDGFVRYATEKNHNLFAKFGYNFSDTTYLDFLFNTNTIKNQNLAFLVVDFLPPDFPYYWNYQQDSKAIAQVASLKFVTNVTPSLNLEAQLKFNKMDFNTTTEYLDGCLFQPPAGTIESQKFVDQKMGFTIKGAYRPSESFSLVSGIDYYRIKADFSNFIASQPLIYVDSVAPFVNMELRKGNLGVTFGARYDYDSSFGSQLSPSLGATYNFGKASLVRFGVARTFKVPPLWYTLGESYFDLILPNPNLKPERAWAYNLGFETQEYRYVYVKASVYYHNMKDGIARVAADIPGRYTWGNITKFIRKGYEAELGVMPGYGFTAYIGTNRNTHKNDTAGAVLTWIPTRTHKLGLKYQNDKLNLLFNLRGRYLWWNMDADTASLFFPHDKKWIFDLKISKGLDFIKGVKANVFLDVFNLTNKLYWDRSDAPNPRRWMDFGLEINF